MEKVQRKKNVVVYNLPESEEEQARDRYKELRRSSLQKNI